MAKALGLLVIVMLVGSIVVYHVLIDRMEKRRKAREEAARPADPAPTAPKRVA